MRLNQEDKKVLRVLLQGLDYLNVGIIENKESDYDYGIDLIKRWLECHPNFFDRFYKEVNYWCYINSYY